MAMQTFHTSDLRVVLLGNVDHGKSTIIGRLLYDTGGLPDGKLEELERTSRSRGMPLEWSFALDALQAERNQAITIDTTQTRVRYGGRQFLIIDAPGHRELLRQMLTGAAQADAAILVVDAAEGLGAQTRRHAYLASFLGLRRLIVLVNKMDLTGFCATRFAEIRDEVLSFLEQVRLQPSAIVPVSARDGDNLVTHSPRCDWYTGPCLVEALAALESPSPATEGPLRFPIQDIYKFDHRRIIVGRVESGVLRTGDTLLFSPTDRVARVRTIESWNGTPVAEVAAGSVAGITLDAPVFVERGDVASGISARPSLTADFRLQVIWFGDEPLVAGATLKARIATDEASVTVEEIERVLDPDNLTRLDREEVRQGEAAWIRVRSRELLAIDSHAALPQTGRCVLVDGHTTVGAGLVDLTGCPDLRPANAAAPRNVTCVSHLLQSDVRVLRNGHQGAVIWLTGLSGAGKSTAAMLAEDRLFRKGYQVYVLDGDNLRHGLNADLAFSAADRRENIRRAGHVAALFADAGFVVIAALISPSAADRALARSAARTGFHEVYVKADLSTCERRDPRGLYQRARAREIPEFTGVSAPYEAPVTPELELDTDTLDIEETVERLVSYIERHARVDRSTGLVAAGAAVRAPSRG
jgi:bifunctional enzyme CysN/CysC